MLYPFYFSSFPFHMVNDSLVKLRLNDQKIKEKTNGHNTVLHAWQSDVILH